MKYSYKFSEKDIIKAFNFVLNYHQNLTKGLRGRTNTGKRGLGGELDEMLPGKLLEIAFCEIINSHPDNKYKIISPDFEIYDNKEVGNRKDPDITDVIENGVLRAPKEFIEIKRLSISDDWIGPRKHQFEEGKKGFMVHIGLEFENNKNIKENDISGSILKIFFDQKKSNFLNINYFSDIGDLEAKIYYAYPFDLIREKGQFFPKGGIIPEIAFPEAANAIKKDGSYRSGYELKKIYNKFSKNKLEMKIEGTDKIPDYGYWTLNGDFGIFENKQKNCLIHSYSNTTMFNEIFGYFSLLEGKTYRFYFKNKLGKGTPKNIDDYWFSKKRLDEIIHSDPDMDLNKQLKKVINNI